MISKLSLSSEVTHKLTIKGCLLNKEIFQRVIQLVNLEMIYPIRIFVVFHVFYVTGPKRVSNLQLTKLNERLDWSAQCELTNKNILPCLTCYF